MGDLGVSNSSRRTTSSPSSSSVSGAGNKLVTIAKDNAPGVLSAVASVDRFVDKLPLVPYETPANPSVPERVVSGVAAVLYTAGAGFSLIPFVGSGFASVAIAGAGAAARLFSPNDEVKNIGNLALQTSAYAFGAGFIGLGAVPYARAAIKSALVALNRT